MKATVAKATIAKVTIATVTTALVVCVAPLGAQMLPSAQQVFARHDSIVGGRAGLDGYTSVRIKGTMAIAAAGIDSPFEILKRKPDRFLFRATLGPLGEMARGFDGTRAWIVAPGQPAQLVSGDPATQIAEQADFFGDLHPADRYTSIETVGVREFEGRRAYEVKETRKNGIVSHEFFDVETGLSLGGETTIVTPTGPVKQVILFTDYKRFGALMLAARTVQRTPQFDIYLTIREVTFDDVPADAILAPPPSTRP